MIKTNHTRRLVLAIAISTTLTVGGAVRSQRADGDEINPIVAFRSAMIDYFKTFGLVPVLATRDFAVGDVIEADGINFFAKAATCFPQLTAPPATPQELPGSIQTTMVGLDAGLSLTRIFAAGAQANLVHRVTISFSRVTSREVDVKSLRATLDRKTCPEIAPLVDGTVAPFKKGEEPFFVVSAVYYGKPEATVEVIDKAQLAAEVARIGQIGQGKFTAGAGEGNTVILKSTRPMVIAIRPVTIPSVVQIGRFKLRGDDSLQLQWKSASCSPGDQCKKVFGPFADVMKAWEPDPRKLH
ncbi:MAG: hypothetical protein JO249_18315 [Acidobacteria bacterium]|nr:hypothetical protein [Acidobacteriota bacterium]